MPSNRLIVLGAILAGIASFCAMLVTQYLLGWLPCPLCMAQRVLLGIAMLGLMGVLVGFRVPGGLWALITAMVGIGVAARHVWLLHNPDAMSTCGVGISYMMDQHYPIGRVLAVLLKGEAECASTTQTILGLLIPEWSVVLFTGYVLVAGLVLLRRN